LKKTEFIDKYKNDGLSLAYALGSYYIFGGA